MIQRENTLTPEEFEQMVRANIKSDETQRPESIRNFMDIKSLE